MRLAEGVQPFQRRLVRPTTWAALCQRCNRRRDAFRKNREGHAQAWQIVASVSTDGFTRPDSNLEIRERSTSAL